MILRLSILLLLGLGACAPGVRERSLVGVDLADMAAVQELGRGLDPAGRAAFSTYVAIHAPSSPGFCGDRLVDREGRDPRTVGEAITLTLVREETVRQAQLAAVQPKTAAQRMAEERDLLVSQREQAIGRQSLLFTRYGLEAKRMPEWTAAERQMAEYDAKLAALRARGFAGV